VTIDNIANLCALGGQTDLTGITVGTGAAATTIDGSGVTLGSGATLTAGGNATVGGTLGVTGNTSLSTLSTSGAATLNSVGVTNNAAVGGTLGVTGNTSLSTLSTSGAATLDSVGVTNNASIGGTFGVAGLTSTNGIDNGGDGITNAGDISGVGNLTGNGTGNITGFAGVTASGTIQGATLTDGAGTSISGGTVTTTTLAATTANVTTLTATSATISTLDTTTLTNSGTVSTNTLAVGAGGMSVAAGAPVDMGGNRIQNVATPVNPTDAANKAYVDSMSGNVDDIRSGLAEQTGRIDSAFRKIEKNTEGIAIAMAMGGLSLPANKDFAFGTNIGFFLDKQAAAAQTFIRLDDNLAFNGGVGMAFGSNEVGGRVGLMAAW
jgi:hypothetical protein